MLVKKLGEKTDHLVEQSDKKMETKFKTIAFLFLVIAMLSCKKDEATEPEEGGIPKTEVPSKPTEGNIVIADTQSDAVKYDDKTITVKSFTVNKILPTVLAGYAQVTIQSEEKDGLFPKYSIGMNMLSGLPAVGVKTNVVGGTTPLIGLNIYEGSTLYAFSAMNGTFTVDSNDGHNAVITVGDIDMKQSFMQGFDASLKKFKVKSFKVKIAY